MGYDQEDLREIEYFVKGRIDKLLVEEGGEPFFFDAEGERRRSGLPKPITTSISGWNKILKSVRHAKRVPEEVSQPENNQPDPRSQTSGEKCTEYVHKQKGFQIGKIRVQNIGGESTRKGENAQGEHPSGECKSAGGSPSPTQTTGGTHGGSVGAQSRSFGKRRGGERPNGHVTGENSKKVVVHSHFPYVCREVSAAVCNVWPELDDFSRTYSISYRQAIAEFVQGGLTKEGVRSYDTMASLWHNNCNDTTCEYDQIVMERFSRGWIAGVRERTRLQTGGVLGHQIAATPEQVVVSVRCSNGYSCLQDMADGCSGSGGSEEPGSNRSGGETVGASAENGVVYCEVVGHVGNAEEPGKPVCGDRAEEHATNGATEEPPVGLLLSDGHGTNDGGETRNSNVGEEQRENMGDVQLHEVRCEELVHISDDAGTTEMTTSPLASGGCSLQPGSQYGAGPKLLRVSFGRDGAEREVNSEEGKERLASIRVPVHATAYTINSRFTKIQLDVANQNTQELPAQRAESSSGKGLTQNTPHVARNEECTVGAIADNEANLWTRSSNRRPRRSNKATPAKKKDQALQEGKRKPVSGTPNKKGLGGEGIREERKVEDRSQRRGPSNDPGSKAAVQYRAGFVHKIDRAPLVQHSGPRFNGNGYTPKDGGKRNEQLPTSAGPTRHVGHDTLPSSTQLRPEQMGHARRSTANGSYAHVVSDVNKRSVVRVPAVKTDPKYSNDGGGSDKVQRRRRGHEWRYDNSSGELYCSACNSTSLPPDLKRNCRRNRVRHYKRQVASGVFVLNDGERAADLVPKYRARPIRGLVEKPSVVPSVGRWRRPRFNNEQQVQDRVGANGTTVVACNGSCNESGRNDGQVLSDNVLSSKTPHGTGQVGHDARPRQSDCDEHGGVQGKCKTVEGIPKNRLVSKGLPTPRNAGFRDFIPSFVQDVGAVSKPGPVREECSGPGLQFEGGSQDCERRTGGSTGVSQEIEICATDSGKPGDGLGTMGNNTRRASSAGEDRSANTQKIYGFREVSLNKMSDQTGGSVEFGTDERFYWKNGDILRSTNPLVHCIGGDCTMGAGFARKVYNRYKPSRESVPVGEALLEFVESSQTGKRLLVSLATKAESGKKPLKEDPYEKHLMSALRDAIAQIDEYHNTASNPGAPKPVEFDVPWLIGTGLDGRRKTDILDCLATIQDELNIKFRIWYCQEEGHYAKNNANKT